jgi:hypothetical protein
MKQSFVGLCNFFPKNPAVAHFDPAKPIYLKTTALGFAIAAIILQ